MKPKDLRLWLVTGAAVVAGAAGAADPSFAPGGAVPVGRTPVSLAAVDPNDDAKAEFAVTGAGNLTSLRQTSSMPPVVPTRTLPGRVDAMFSTRGRITKLAADGNRVAVITATNAKRTRGRVVVWTAPGRKSTSFDIGNRPLGVPHPNYEGGSLCKGGPSCLDELALGGGQVAWIARSGGNSLELFVIAAKLSGGAPKYVDQTANGDGAGADPNGGWLGQLLGGGSLLAYNTWTICETLDPHEPRACPPIDPATHHVLAEERLVRIAAGRRVVVRRGPGSYRLAAVGGGRMAVVSAGAVMVLAPSGSRVATVPAVTGDPSRAIALSRTRLAIARTLTLDVYDSVTGTEVQSIPLGPSAALRLAGVNSKLTLLRGPRRLVLVRLSDNKQISLPLRSGPATTPIDARLTDAGLFYTYNVPRASAKGRIVFEPNAKLLARF
jgi:hypothetical protein